jgi:hypothetical protein
VFSFEFGSPYLDWPSKNQQSPLRSTNDLGSW